MNRMVKSTKMCQRKNSGFTLVELCVTVGIIAVLIGIMLPALSGAANAGKRTVLLTNQREAMRVVEEFSADHGDVFPNAGDESGVTASWEWHGAPVQKDYWSQPEHWGWMVQSKGYNGYVSLGPSMAPARFDVDPGCGECGLGVRSLHVLSGTLLGKSELYEEGAAVTRELSTRVRTSDVRHPAHKGVLYQLYFTSQTSRTDGQHLSLVHFADGHGAHIPADSLRPGVTGDMPYAGVPVLATKDGYKGRDL